MSGSETGVMTSSGRDGYSGGGGMGGLPKSPIQNMRLAFSTGDGAAIYKPAVVNAYQQQQQQQPPPPQPPSASSVDLPPGINVNMGFEPIRKKRGRPRKYGPDAATMSLALGSTPQPLTTVNQSSGGGHFSSPPPPPPSAGVAQPQPTPADLGSGESAYLSSGPIKKARGRPPGSSSKKQHHPGTAGLSFTPHVITVKTGEDVSSKIMAFSQHGPRAICILSANGAISNVTLRQPATSGGSVTYEGRFEILSLSGSFQLTENGGQRSRTGGLSVSLSSPDGRVVGGGVAGLLMAASPVQVIVGSFVLDGRKESKAATHVDPSSMATKLAPVGGLTGASSSPSRETLNDSSGGPGSPHNHGAGPCNNNNPHGISSMPWK